MVKVVSNCSLPSSHVGQPTQSLSARQASQGSLKAWFYIFVIHWEESPDVVMITCFFCYTKSEEEKTKTEMNKDILTGHTDTCKVNFYCQFKETER